MRGHDLSNRVARLERWVDYLLQFAPKSLTAGSGTFSLTGSDASLIAGSFLTAGAGTFALTGQTATLRRSLVMSTAAGNFVLTGQSVTLKKGLFLTAGAGSFALTGSTATLRRTRLVAAAAGSFVLTGQDATLSIPASGLSLFASSTSSGTTITVPTGIADGDLAVLVDRGFGFSGVPTAVTPSGYTSRANVAAPASQRVMVTTKILTTADDSATVTGMASDNSRKRLMIFRRVGSIASVAASAVTSVYSDNTDPAAASASYTGLSGSSITLGILASGFTTTPTSPSFSPTETGVLAAGELRVYYLLTYTGDPGSVSVDQGNTSTRNQNILLNLDVT